MSALAGKPDLRRQQCTQPLLTQSGRSAVDLAAPKPTFPPVVADNEARTIRLLRGDSRSNLQGRRSRGVDPFRALDSFERCRLRFRSRKKAGRSRLYGMVDDSAHWRADACR
jgi:hypothetical protein